MIHYGCIAVYTMHFHILYNICAFFFNIVIFFNVDNIMYCILRIMQCGHTHLAKRKFLLSSTGMVLITIYQLAGSSVVLLSWSAMLSRRKIVLGFVVFAFGVGYNGYSSK